MGPFIVLAGLAWLIFIDAKTLKAQDEDLYEKIIRFDPKLWACGTVLLLILAWPFYLKKRFKFIKGRDLKQGDLISQEEALRQRYTTDACGMLLYWFLAVFFFSFIVYFLKILIPVFNEELSQMIAVAVFSSCLLVLFIFQITKNAPYQGFLTSVGLRRGGRSLFVLIVPPFFVGCILAYLATTLMASRLMVPATPLTDALEASTSSLVLLLFVGLAVLIAPLLEEIIFRGYFYSILLKVKGKAFAIGIVSLAFAFLHVGQYWGDWLAIFIVALMGLSLTLFRAWSGSTISSAVAHYSYNLLLVLLPIIMLFNTPYGQYQTMYQQLGFEEKEKLLLKSVEEHPEFSDAYNDLAWLYAKERVRLLDALQLIEIALKDQPGNAAFLDTKAEVFFQLGEFQRAIDIEEDLAEQYPEKNFYQDQLKRFKVGSEMSRQPITDL